MQEAGAESGQLSAPGRLPCSRDCPRSQHLRGGYLYRDPKDGVEGSAHPDRTNYRGPVKTSSGDCTRPGEASLVRPQGNKGQGQTSGPGGSPGLGRLPRQASATRGRKPNRGGGSRHLEKRWAFLVPGTSFVEDSFSTNWELAGERFGDKSNALYLLCHPCSHRRQKLAGNAKVGSSCKHR